MDYEIFTQGISSLAKWFKKKLDTEQVDVYYNRLDYIPNIAFLDIAQDLIDNTKPNPSLFPTINELKAGWWKWQLDNPSMIEKREKVECPECFDSGWLWFKAEDPKTKIVNQFMVGCEACKNRKVDIGITRKVPLSTRAKLEAKGYQVYPYEDEAKKTYQSVDEMAADVGERILL